MFRQRSLAAGAWRMREAARQAIAEGDLERARISQRFPGM
jgi:hypothetical protein